MTKWKIKAREFLVVFSSTMMKSKCTARVLYPTIVFNNDIIMQIRTYLTAMHEIGLQVYNGGYENNIAECIFFTARLCKH